MPTRVAILDDYQGVALSMADWSALGARVSVQPFHERIGKEDEIAERLVVTPGTAKTHVSRAMVKLHAHNRAKLVVFAYEAGLVVPRAEAPVPARQPLALAT